MIMGVDPILLGNYDGGSYNNKTEAAKQFWIGSGLSVAANAQKAITNALRMTNTHIEFDISGIESLQADRKDTFDMFMEMSKAGYSTGNEVRNAAGAEPMNGLDTLKNQSNE